MIMLTLTEVSNTVWCMCKKRKAIEARTNTSIAPLLISVVALALVGALRVGAQLVARVRVARALVHVAAVGSVFVHLVAGPAKTLVRTYTTVNMS